MKVATIIIITLALLGFFLVMSSCTPMCPSEDYSTSADGGGGEVEDGRGSEHIGEVEEDTTSPLEDGNSDDVSPPLDGNDGSDASSSDAMILMMILLPTTMLYTLFLCLWVLCRRFASCHDFQ